MTRGYRSRPGWWHDRRDGCPIGYGNVNGYNNQRCRCPLCREARRAYHAHYFATTPAQVEAARERATALRRTRGMRLQSDIDAERQALHAGIVELVRKGVRREEVAEKFGVCLRTVHRAVRAAEVTS